MPLAVLPMWIFGLLSLALLFGGGYIVYEWWQGAIVSTAVLVAGIAMLDVTLLGRFIVLAFHRGGKDDTSWVHDVETVRIERPRRYRAARRDEWSRGRRLGGAHAPALVPR